MASDLQAADLKGRIGRVEDWVRALRWLVVIVAASFGLQIWFLVHPRLFQPDTIRARNVTIVDEKGNRVAILSSENGLSGLSFYDTNHIIPCLNNAFRRIGRSRHFDSSRHTITPRWSANLTLPGLWKGCP